MLKPQPADLEAIQPSSFDEILKDEEKKLLEAQEVSAPAVAAVLAAVQMPLAAEPASDPEKTAEVEAGRVNPQGASARTIQPEAAAVYPNISTPKYSAAQPSHEKQSVETKVEGANPQPLSSMPNARAEQGGAVVEAVSTENVQQTSRAAEQLNAQTTSGESLLAAVDSGAELEMTVALPTSQTKVDGEKIAAADSGATESALNVDGSKSQQPSNIREAVNEVSVEGVDKPQNVSAPAAASQPQPADEKKEVEVKQEVDPRTVAIGLNKEAAVVKDAGKLSTTEVDHAQAADVIQQIASQMKLRIKSGNSSMHLQLNPKDLGAIDVQMVRNPQGVSVTFFAEQAATGQLLETQLNQLRQSLKDAGVQLTGLNISQYDQPKQEGGFYKQEPHFSQYSQRSAPHVELTGKERERPEGVVRSTTEVDYLI